MNLLWNVLSLPLTPLRGTVWVAERVLEQAERQHYDPASIRRQLDDVARARESGEIDDEQADAMEQELVARLIQSRRRPDKEG